MKHPYLSAEMDIQHFGSRDIINCSDDGGDPGPSHNFETTADPDVTKWVPTCNQGKPDYNAWN